MTASTNVKVNQISLSGGLAAKSGNPRRVGLRSGGLEPSSYNANVVMSKLIIQIEASWVPPKRSKTTPFSIVSAPFSIVSAPFSIENGAETKHLNSTRTARPPQGPGSSSRIQMLKSSVKRISRVPRSLASICPVDLSSTGAQQKEK